ncbi:MAG: NifT/FixU family protein [Pseudomonadota bacterium]
MASIEFESEDKWGGEITLTDGSSYYLDPIPMPSLPKTVRVRRSKEGV